MQPLGIGIYDYDATAITRLPCALLRSLVAALLLLCPVASAEQTHTIHNTLFQPLATHLSRTRDAIHSLTPTHIAYCAANCATQDHHSQLAALGSCNLLLAALVEGLTLARCCATLLRNLREHA